MVQREAKVEFSNFHTVIGSVTGTFINVKMNVINLRLRLLEQTCNK